MKRTVLAAVLIVLGFTAGVVWARQEPPKKAYMLVQVDVTNPDQYAQYTKATPAIVEKFGGRFIARGGRSMTLEGRPAPARVAVVEFPSYERVQEFYNSSDYQAAKKLRAGAATAQFIVVEGL